MNRPIKFRAWDVNRKRFLVADEPTFCISITKDFQFSYHYLKTTEDIIIQQFTGLYDCEGKEIYESDIVEASWGYTGVVDFEEILFYKYECRISDDIKVIGNIHEQLLD